MTTIMKLLKVCLFSIATALMLLGCISITNTTKTSSTPTTNSDVSDALTAVAWFESNAPTEASLTPLPTIRSISTVTPTLTPTATVTFTPTITPTEIGGGAGKIAFTSERDGYQEIYVMNSDGSNLIKLTNSVTPQSDPAWSPDGKKIAFASNSTDSATLYIMNADGTNPTKLIDIKELRNYSRVTSGRFSIGYPTWSPDGTKITFRAYRYVGCCLALSDIFVMNVDGSNLISAKGYPWENYAPVWYPDSQKIAFDSDSCGEGGGICVMNADGTDSHSITQNGGAPVWSPDGKKIAFGSGRDRKYGNINIYVMNADGTNPINLTPYLSGWGGNLSWSPDGEKIIFVSSGDGDNEIYVINSDGTNLINLTNNQAGNGSPVWSPDGKKLFLFQSAMGTRKFT